MGGRHRNILAAAALLCLVLPASVAARPDGSVGATWIAPTPGEGTRIVAQVGKQVSFALGATAPGAPAVSVVIHVKGRPASAGWQTAPGNPAHATFNWIPPRSAAGRTVQLTFTAQPTAPGMASAVRHLSIAVAKPPKPKPKTTFVLSSEKHELYRYAFVIRTAVARSAPRRTAAAVAGLSRWTPEGTTNLVLALEGKRTKRGVWIKVRLPVLPANRTGWVQRKALSDWKELRTRLVVDRRRLTATLFKRGKVIFKAPVGIGEARYPTPRGEFYIRNQLYGFGNPVYGPIAFGTSARSPVLTDWPGGGFIGIHGTNQPGILPGRVSHGCIRMKNPHILRLAKLMPVGTPLSVR